MLLTRFDVLSRYTLNGTTKLLNQTHYQKMARTTFFLQLFFIKLFENVITSTLKTTITTLKMVLLFFYLFDRKREMYIVKIF